MLHRGSINRTFIAQQFFNVIYTPFVLSSGFIIQNALIDFFSNISLKHIKSNKALSLSKRTFLEILQTLSTLHRNLISLLSKRP